MLTRPGQPGMSEELSASILDRLGVPIFIVEEDGNLRYANAAGADMLAHGGPLRSVNNTLCTDDMPDGERLKSAIASSCADGESQTILMKDEGGKHPPIAMIAPFRNGADTHNAIVLLRCAAETNNGLLQSLRQLFHLSPAEAAIAIALAAGVDLLEISQARHVKLNTLRSQIASIMSKTGTRRQAELVALIARLESPI